MTPRKFVPEWEWYRVVEEYPDYIDVKLRIKHPKTGRLTALFINTFREVFKLPMTSELLASILQNARAYAGLEATTIRIDKNKFKTPELVKNVIAEYTARLKKFCIYVDESITEYINENSIYNWVWDLAVFNRETERFEPTVIEEDEEETAYSDMADFFIEKAGGLDD